MSPLDSFWSPKEDQLGRIQMAHQITSYPLRLPTEIRERLEQEAKREKRSLNFIINQYVTKGMELGEESDNKLIIEKVKFLMSKLEHNL
ncbi:TPA: Arc family DNA-binding protein [Vibrio mimicus]